MNKHALTLILFFFFLVNSANCGNEGRRIYDISHKIGPKLPLYASKDGLGQFSRLVTSIKIGNISNESVFTLRSGTGTHVDAPSRFYQDYYDRGFDVTTLSLHTLNGPALVVDVPRDKNITAKVIESLNIPKGVHRVLFKTLNTDRKLMHKTEFQTDFTGFTKDGANWLVQNTHIKLVGLDYLSVSNYDDVVPTHLTFLKSREIIPLEGVNLDGIEPGKYTVHCLPLKMVGADGCPARCILTT